MEQVMKHMILIFTVLLSAPLAVVHTAELKRASPVDIGSRRELFVDHYLIESLDGARLVLHRPQAREVGNFLTGTCICSEACGFGPGELCFRPLQEGEGL